MTDTLSLKETDRLRIVEEAPTAGTGRLVSFELLRGLNSFHFTSVLVATVDRALLGAWDRGVSAARLRDEFADTIMPGGAAAARRIQWPTIDKTNRTDHLALACLDLTLIAEATARAAIEGEPAIGFATLDRNAPYGSLVMVWETRRPLVSRRAAALALRFLADRLGGIGPRDESRAFAAQSEAFRSLLRERRLSNQAAVLAEAARGRGIPYELIDHRRLRLGEGARQVVLNGGMLASVPLASVKLARDRHHSLRRLAASGLPTPKIETVASVSALAREFKRLDGPVMLRRARITDRSGAMLRSDDPEQLKAAFERLSDETGSLVAEKIEAGAEYRLLVVGGSLVAAVRSTPPAVMGDGKRTIAELVASLNDDPHRDGFRLRPVRPRAALVGHLAQLGITLDTVPDAGTEVALAPSADPSAGASSTDVTDEVHDENRQAAERAAKLLGLPIAWVHMICPDIARSHRETGGCIAAVFPDPWLGAHRWPLEGHSRDVGKAIVDYAAAKERVGRIPSALIVGDRGANSTARTLDRLLTSDGRVVARALKSGAAIGRRKLDLSAKRLEQAPRVLVRDPSVTALVAATSAVRLLRIGALRNHWDAVLVAPPAEDTDEDRRRRVIGMFAAAEATRLVFDIEDGAALAAAADIDPGRVIAVALAEGLGEDAFEADDRGVVVFEAGEGETAALLVRKDGRVVATRPVRELPASLEGTSREVRLWSFALYAAMAQDLEKLGSDGADPADDDA